MHFTVATSVFCQDSDFHGGRQNGDGGRTVMEASVCLHLENVCIGSQYIAVIQAYTGNKTIYILGMYIAKVNLCVTGSHLGKSFPVISCNAIK